MPYLPYTSVGTFVDGSTAVPVSAANLNQMNAGILAVDSKTLLLAGVGIDPTGNSDATTAVQTFLDACPDGTTVVIPNGATIQLTNTVTINHRITLTGTGTLQWTNGIAGSPALTVNANGAALVGIRVVSTVTPNQTGAKQYGIWITAHGVKVTGCTTMGLQQAIAVSPYGEYHDFIIAENHVFDVPGSGDGASNGSSSNGEDRGDGIVSWGAAGVIVGNRVVARSGTDARIGIHVEGLGGLAGTPYAHGDSMVTILGNTVTGQFRRGIVSEGVATTTITGNTVSDATWWGIAVIGTSGCTVASNTIYWTRTSNDNQGSAWNPRRSGLMMYASGVSNSFIGNNIVVASGAQLPFGISAQSDSTGNIDYLTINGNQVIDNSNGMGPGIYLDGSVNLIRSARVINNTIAGYNTQGAYLYACSDIDVSHNELIAGSASAQGLHLESSNSSARIDGNSIFRASTAIYCYQRNAITFVCNNIIQAATTGIDLYGCAGATVNSNLFSSVTTKTTNLPSGAVTVGNN